MLLTALHELQQALEREAAPVAACLAPGLPRANIQALAERHEFVMPEDLTVYFGWHDGLRADRDHDVELMPGLRPLSLAESLALRDQLRDTLAILPDPAPVLRAPWLPLLADDAGAFWLAGIAPESAVAVYAFELEDPANPTRRFSSLAALARALTELFSSGAYRVVENRIQVVDRTAEAAILAARKLAQNASAVDGARLPRDADPETVDTVAANNLARSLAAGEGEPRAREAVEAVKTYGLATVLAAIDRLELGARDEVARSLGTIERTDAAPVLLHLLADSEDYVRETAAGAIGFTGCRAAGAALLPLLDSPNHNLRKAAAFSLGELRVDAAAEPLLALTADANPVVRAAAVTSIGKIAAPVPIGPLTRLLDDSNADAAQMTAWALGEIGDPAARAALEKASGSGDRTLARIARESLKRLPLSD